MQRCYCFYGNRTDGSRPVSNFSRTISRQMNSDPLCQKSLIIGLFGEVIPEYRTCPGFYPRDVVSAVLATTTWLAGWVSVTRGYCIKTAKPILKLFRPTGSPIILVSFDLCADTKFQRNPFCGGVKYTEGGKIGYFRRISPFISETVRDRPMVTMER